MNLIRQDRNESNHWTNEVLRCLLTLSDPKDAASAAAAAWLVTGNAESAVVIQFTSASDFIIARASRDSSDNVEVSVGSEQHSIAALFASDQLQRIASCPALTQKSEQFVWPDRLAVCLVEGANHQNTPAAGVAAGILAKAQSQQIQIPDADQMESMAEFAAGAGHEINNPLGSIIGQTQLLLKQEQQTDRRQALGTIGSQAWRIRDMIGDCMLFARPPAPDLQNCDLSKLITQAATDAVNSLEQSADSLQLDLPMIPVAIKIDPGQIQTLVSHLVRNSVEASLNSESKVDVHISLETEKNAIILTVQDQGPGVLDDKLRRHLFDPFFSGRQAGRGIGFGLPVCWQIAKNHGGLILQESPDQGGARFVVVLPRSL